MKRKILFGIVLISLLLMVGCDTITPKNIFCMLCEWLPLNVNKLSLNNAEQLLVKNPNTELSAVMYDKASLLSIKQQFNKECGSLPVKDYYRLEFKQKDMSIAVWVDKQTEQPVCVYRGSEIITKEEKPPAPPKEENVIKPKQQKTIPVVIDDNWGMR